MIYISFILETEIGCLSIRIGISMKRRSISSRRTWKTIGLKRRWKRKSSVTAGKTWLTVWSLDYHWFSCRYNMTNDPQEHHLVVYLVSKRRREPWTPSSCESPLACIFMVWFTGLAISNSRILSSLTSFQFYSKCNGKKEEEKIINL